MADDGVFPICLGQWNHRPLRFCWVVSMTAVHDEADELMFDLGARRYLVQMKEPGGICGTGVD